MKAKQDTRKGRNLKKNTHKTGFSQDVKHPFEVVMKQKI